MSNLVQGWRLLVWSDARYQVTWRLELTRRKLQKWNRFEVEDIFRRLEAVEVAISNF